MDMKTFNKRWLRASPVAVVTAALSLLMVPTVGTAEEEASEGPLETLIVTASRRDESVVEVPASLVVLDTDQTIRQGIVDINALADLSPGLTATDGGSPGLGNLVIRGLYAGGAPTTGTYVDDVPYGAVVGGFAANTALDASLYDLERIEIAKGPQGTLFGAGSVGGVVRYVTRGPDMEQFSGYGYVDYSTTQDGGENTLLRARASAPIISDVLAVSVSGYKEDAGGYIDAALTGEDDIDESEYYGYRVAARWVASERFSVEASYAAHEADFDSASYETFDTTTGLPIFGDGLTEFAAPRELEFDVWALTAELDLGFASLVSITSDQTVKITNTTDLTAAFGPTADALAPAGAPHTVGFSSGDDTDRFTQEIRLTSQGDGRVHWILGAYYTKQESDSFQITNVVPNDIELVTLVSGTEYTEYAVFGNLTYEISDSWDITAGLRYSDNENDIDQAFTGALSNPALSGLQDSRGDDVTTWLFNSRYWLNDQTNLYARIASGYRPGGANLTVNFGGMILGEPTFESDELWSYEIGIKGYLLDERLHYDLAAFIVDWEDAQIAVINAAGLGSIDNTQDAVEARGIEVSISGELFDNFVMGATFAWTDTELQGDEPGLNAISEEELIGIPDVTGSLVADYTHPLSNDVDLTAGATLRYTSGYPTGFSGSPNGNFLTDGYAQIDVRAGIRYRQIAVNLYVTNLGEEDAYQTVFPQAPAFGYGVPLRPRTVGVNLRVDI